MKKLKVVLALITRDNDYQLEQAAVAEATAKRLGIELKVVYANSDAVAQTQQVLTAVQVAPGIRPDAVVVEPVGTGMPAVAQAAVKNGVGWIVIGRDTDYLVPLRAGSELPIGSIDNDNEEIGRIQGRQFAALLPTGGVVWYVEGPATDVAKLRRAGVEAVLPKNIQLVGARGRWTQESAVEVITARAQALVTRAPPVQLIGCQNDAMAMGARKALEALAKGPHREAWLSIPFTGVDGVPTTGQQWVQKGLLTATVIKSPPTGLALELLAQAFAGGERVPEKTVMRPVSYPPLDALEPVATR